MLGTSNGQNKFTKRILSPIFEIKEILFYGNTKRGNKIMYTKVDYIHFKSIHLLEIAKAIRMKSQPILFLSYQECLELFFINVIRW